MNEWQPIETAPKGSKHILGFGAGMGILSCSYVMEWDDKYEGWDLAFRGTTVWPTHWMPLPSPPKAEVLKDAE